MTYRYVLDAAGVPVPEPDLLKWAAWYGKGKNRVTAQDRLPNGALVSTIFLGLDYRPIATSDVGAPVLWETMVLDAPDGDHRQTRYTTQDAARAGHAEVVAEVSRLTRRRRRRN